MTEREAEDAILKVCRSGCGKGGQSQNGHWCMRVLSLLHMKYERGRCAVLDVAHSDPDAPEYSKMIAQGHTWVEVWEKLP